LFAFSQIIVSVFLPRLREFEFVQAYKQARRRDDDIAIVNACFRVHLTQSPEGIPTVAEASFAFGGLGPVTLAARQTDAVILGRAWNEDTLEAVVAALQLDFPLTADAPGGMPQYRQTLAASFFMKFFLTVKQQLGGAVPASQTSATEKRHRPASQSTQLFEVLRVLAFLMFKIYRTLTRWLTHRRR
jgi:xanthine dehydrogenase/oxidase